MKRVSPLWTLVPWLVPQFAWPLLPAWVIENVERAVYDGMTREEWFAKQVDDLMAANARNKRGADK